MRFPVDLRLYRRYEELTQWEAFVHKHFPDRPIPTTKKDRARLHKAVDPVLLDDPDFQKLHQQFRTKIDLGIALLEAAIQHKVPFRVLLFDSWYLADELVSMARYRKKDWISLLKKNRNLETNSFVLKDAAGHPIRLDRATYCGGRPGPAHPAHRVPGGDRGGHHLLDVYAGRASPRARQSPAGT